MNYRDSKHSNPNSERDSKHSKANLNLFSICDHSFAAEYSEQLDDDNGSNSHSLVQSTLPQRGE